MSNNLEIFVDGACSGNPGEAAIGVAIYQDGKIIKEISKPIGLATNNIAEYSALIAALEEAGQLNAHELKIFTDSELMYKQTIGAYQVKNEQLLVLFKRVKELSGQFKNIQIQHVLREKNKHADSLATGALKINRAKVVAPLFKHSEEESPSSKG